MQNPGERCLEGALPSHGLYRGRRCGNEFRDRGDRLGTTGPRPNPGLCPTAGRRRNGLSSWPSCGPGRGKAACSAASLQHSMRILILVGLGSVVMEILLTRKQPTNLGDPQVGIGGISHFSVVDRKLKRGRRPRTAFSGFARGISDRDPNTN